MYKRSSDSWLKHWDFIILDMLCLQAAFLVAYAASGYGWDPYAIPLYRNMALFIEIADFLVLVAFKMMSDVLKRSHWQELKCTVEQGLVIGALSILYLFLMQEGQNYSRLASVLTVVLYICFSLPARFAWKVILLKTTKNKVDTSLLIVTDSSMAKIVISNVMKNNFARYRISGLAIVDDDAVGSQIAGVNVIANRDSLVRCLCQEWVDEALVVLPSNYHGSKEVAELIAETGVVVHCDLTDQLYIPGMRQFTEEVVSYPVMTTSMNYASPVQLFAKRFIDIVIGLLGCVVAGVATVFVAPMILAESPGPIFFAQERVGRNGRRFKMYKFRSMHLDAEDRKASLMDQNKIQDPKMFKLDFDPRVIGNTVLADGTQKKGIGDFIRRTSLDEFPQFFNVLKGDMSVVGTRPPLPSETNLYDSRHRARLAIKPGITGMWQISGRSNITDFEEVVRLDKEYINNWSIRLDLKILLKTIRVVLKGDGSV